MNRARIFLAIFILSAMAIDPAAAARLGAAPLERAVVKVITVAAPPNYNLPWQSGAQNIQGGSGVVIEPSKVLTNAHVVANQTFVQVQRQGDPTKYPARVLVAGHECDLALLEVPDPRFMNGVRPLTLGKMPTVRDKVAAYGFPIGGDKLSITEGVVSRVEMGQYSHCWKQLPVVQIDAAINPGNSGGPVIMDGKIVGIAFQGIGQAENVGYMIPPPVVGHFLQDAGDGDYDGFPGMGINFQTMENPDHRRYLGMSQDQSGVVITRVAFESPAWGKLEPDDVILEVEGHSLANDGTVSFLGDERILFSYYLVDKFPGDNARLVILRNGERRTVDLFLAESRPIISTCEYDVMPSYYIFGGFVFSPLTLNYLEASGGNNWWYASPVELRFHLISDIATPDRGQVVILQYVLADEANVGYHDFENEVAVSVNGEPIRDLADLVDKIGASKAEFIEIDTESGFKLIISARAAREANPRIMERYRIPADRSEDLKK